MFEKYGETKDGNVCLGMIMGYDMDEVEGIGVGSVF